MIDREKVKRLKAADKSPEKAGIVSDTTLSGLTINELIAFRAKIDTFLPSLSIRDMDLEQELLLQYIQTKTLLASVIDDDETPANQKAQLMNTCNSILSEITKSQTALYNAERLKIMEQAIINALKGSSDEVANKFFENYEREVASIKR